jgi:hypothetical protein
MCRIDLGSLSVSSLLYDILLVTFHSNFRCDHPAPSSPDPCEVHAIPPVPHGRSRALVHLLHMQNPCRFARQRLCYGIRDSSLDGEALPPDCFTNDRFFKASVDHCVLMGQCSGAERTQRSGAACRVRRSGVR